jgi:hypothetical protein
MWVAIANQDGVANHRSRRDPLAAASRRLCPRTNSSGCRLVLSSAGKLIDSLTAVRIIFRRI